jgi:hypothetical protein
MGGCGVRGGEPAVGLRKMLLSIAGSQLVGQKPAQAAGTTVGGGCCGAGASMCNPSWLLGCWGPCKLVSSRGGPMGARPLCLRGIGVQCQCLRGNRSCPVACSLPCGSGGWMWGRALMFYRRVAGRCCSGPKPVTVENKAQTVAVLIP